MHYYDRKLYGESIQKTKILRSKMPINVIMKKYLLIGLAYQESFWKDIEKKTYIYKLRTGNVCKLGLNHCA